MSQRRPILDEVRAFYKPKAGGLNQTWPRPLIASGRAVHHLNMAISWLGETNELEAATYHTFAGVASAAAAVDGMALFLNFWFVAGCEGPPTRTEPWPRISSIRRGRGYAVAQEEPRAS